MYVYIVQEGEYDSKTIIGTFSSLAKAMDSLIPNPNRIWRTYWDAWWVSDTDHYQVFKFEVDKVEV